MLYHLGCGHQRIDGFVNVDIQSTEATDLVLDLNTLEGLPEQSSEGFFSHAFFEHLYRDSRADHLRALRERLVADGFVCYLGLPDFRRVAEMYLSGGRGIEGPIFDLHNVYRFTHGHPEIGTDWNAQLHKSLFDSDELERLLRDAGYSSYVIFRYVFPGDPPEFDLSLGFYATGTQRPVAELVEAAREFLQRFDGRFVTVDTLNFAVGRSSPSWVARANGSSSVHMLRTIAYRAACRLAALS